MDNDNKPLTKAEARAFVKRAREALREMDRLIDQGGDVKAMVEWANEATGSVVYVMDAAENRESWLEAAQ